MEKKFPFKYMFFQGEFVPSEKAKVSLMTNAFQYGTGCFGGIRGYLTRNKTISLFRINDHYQRLLNSAKILGMKVAHSKEELVKITIKLIKKNKPEKNIYLRPFFYDSSYNLGPNLAKGEFDFALYMIPLDDYLDISKGLSVCISSWIRINDNMIPSRAKVSGGYVNSALARAEAERRGFDEAIFLDSTGHVCEGSAENIFIVKNKTLITPPESADILEGITRRTILELAKDLNIPTIKRTIDRTEVYAANEAFFTGTGVQLAWIASVDGRKIGDGKIGKITQKLQKLYFKIVKGEEKKYLAWCTKIKIT